MSRNLSRRLALAMDLGDAMPDEREQVNEAAQTVRTFDELPPAVRALVLRWEKGTDPRP